MEVAAKEKLRGVLRTTCDCMDTVANADQFRHVSRFKLSMLSFQAFPFSSTINPAFSDADDFPDRSCTFAHHDYHCSLSMPRKRRTITIAQQFSRDK